MKMRIFPFILMLCLSLTLQAQTTYTARVQSTDGSPIEGVIVSVQGDKATAITDANGEFSLKTEQKEAYIQLATPGFYTRKVALTSATESIVMVPVATALYNGEVVLDHGVQVRDEASAVLSTVLNKDFKTNPSASLAWQDVDPA
ncbi:MAG: carboxypeptidase-like regulatory domain-containing protein, partial [Bacteroidales bacterium]|nr:carboxypeptidase-like regulatory domain-containing protein [Bacteroidales bacterium]